MEHGPIDQFRDELGLLAKKLEPKKGFKGVIQSFVWTLDKADIVDILEKIGRVKSCVVLAMQGDTM